MLARCIRTNCVTLVLATSVAMLIPAVPAAASLGPECELDSGTAGILLPLPPTCDADYATASYYAGADVYVEPEPTQGAYNAAPPQTFTCDKGVSLAFTLANPGNGVPMKVSGNVKCKGTFRSVEMDLQIRKDGNLRRSHVSSAGAVPDVNSGFAANAFDTYDWTCADTGVHSYRGRVVYWVTDALGSEHGPYSVRTQSFRGRCV